MNPKEPINLHPVFSTASGDLMRETAAPVHDCWNTIGVEGNGTCVKLQEFVHCRNCPVFSSAGIQLLDRPLAADYRKMWTEHFAQEKKLVPPVRLSVVIFRVGTEWLALSTKAFQEVAERRSVHSLPHRRRKIVLGLVNVRGELLICASLSRLLGLKEAPPPAPRKAHDRLLVGSWHGNRFAFPVEEVHGIHRFQQSELREPPATVSRSAQSHTLGVIAWRERMVGVLDPDHLFSSLNQNLT